VPPVAMHGIMKKPLSDNSNITRRKPKEKRGKCGRKRPGKAPWQRRSDNLFSFWFKYVKLFYSLRDYLEASLHETHRH
ncbi:MAG: hypothetical protein J6T14_08045, partial [Clostridia bacterium]|nr:hypothetical protein [Clostridia bacterium]